MYGCPCYRQHQLDGIVYLVIGRFTMYFPNRLVPSARQWVDASADRMGAL